MTDIATYDAASARAESALPNWLHGLIGRSEAFQSTGFPTHITSLFQLKMLIASLRAGKHDAAQKELGGIRDEDIGVLAEAARMLCELQKSLFCDDAVVLPAGSLLVDYLTFRKIAAMSPKRRILDIGPGCGYLSLFLRSDPDVDTYAQIEVTQSLYLLQSHINRAAYGGDHAELAMQSPDGPAVFGRASAMLPAQFAKPAIVRVVRKPRCIHFPWWKIDEALKGQYDVVLLGEAMCEMSFPAFIYYAEGVKDALSDNGHVFINGIGQSQSRESIENRLAIWKNLQFRAILSAQSFQYSGRLSRANLLLVKPGHPRYDEATDDLHKATFPEQDPMIRTMYGLDRAAGEDLSEPQLLERLARVVS